MLNKTQENLESRLYAEVRRLILSIQNSVNHSFYKAVKIHFFSQNQEAPPNEIIFLICKYILKTTKAQLQVFYSPVLITRK